MACGVSQTHYGGTLGYCLKIANVRERIFLVYHAAYVIVCP